MQNTSQSLVLDERLLAVEALFSQRLTHEALLGLDELDEGAFLQQRDNQGLFYSLTAQRWLHAGEYRKALETGLRASRLLAETNHTVRYARSLLTLAHAYFSIGDLKNSDIRSRDAQASYRRAGDVEGQIDALNTQARVSFTRGDYSAAASLVDDAIALCANYPRKLAQLTGNAGRIKTLSGQWIEAERDVNSAIEYDTAHSEEVSLAINLLSLGYLQMRRRDFLAADRSWKRSQALIDKHHLKRERIILLEYTGEMAFEKGDMNKAKSLFSEALHQGKLLAPDSALVSQAARRLADVELALDNHSEALKIAQQALELSLQLSEKLEIALSRKIIAQVFATRNNGEDALEYINQAIEVVRDINDPYELARTLLVYTDICIQYDSHEPDKIRACFDEAIRIFKRLKIDFWLAESDFRAGVYACQHGDLARGFRKISRAERLFVGLNDTTKVRSVNQFLSTLADQAVALSISQANSFKVFGNLVSSAETKDFRLGGIDDVLKLLLEKTQGSRVVIFSPDFDDLPLVSSFEMSPVDMKRFVDRFRQLLGQEISQTKPTLMLDCRRDPYINDLFANVPALVASVIVVPFRSGENSRSYLYIDRLSSDNTIDPFGQHELNFAVGCSDLIAFTASELQKNRLLEDNRRLKAQLRKETAFPNIITRNAAMLEMLNQIRQVVDANISVIIEGETGCGKDLLARAIHYNSMRRDKRFISVNCAALPETLLESELFGYRKGAFTGADRDKTGLLEEADGGTFFLDEIADMPLSVQVKLLRAIESKEIVRLGESTPRKVDVRILSATNKDLKEEMDAQRFRQDLYYRLSAISFKLPALRERKDDIPLLINHFLIDSGKTVSNDALSHLVAYDWPGNIRELENELKKLILLTGDHSIIESEQLSHKIADSGHTHVNGHANGSTNGRLPEQLPFTDSYSLYDFLGTYERGFIIKALRDAKGVKKHAADLLSIPESTLRLKIKEYRLDLTRLDQLH